MSASWGLVKFKKTGNVYMCCYEGTTDYMRPFFCTPEECYDEKDDCYCSITHCRDLSRGRSWVFPDDVEDLDECELYSDYGGGFHWRGTGSESLRMIKDGIDPYNSCYDEMMDGKPEWVEEFERKLMENE